ncbi:MAG TPA: lysylphosphatidylglycerol synthase transmembrane domain-containing protein [Gemmatimonadaceae bacterium]|nr:lysylphosphatidylglycerol synthase transmembrane domain-containing protein [Gemmatimonadaceae bacterium]
MRIGLRGALGIGLSAVLLVWALHDVSPAQVWEELRRADPWYFLAATVTGTLIFPLRAIRWRVILDPVAPHIAFGPLWRGTAIGMMVNNVVPVRAGELARAYALAREEPRVTFSAGIASLAVDRLFDSIVVLLLMLYAMLDPRFGASAMPEYRAYAERAAVVGAVGLTVVMVGLYAMVFFPSRFIALFELFARRVAPRVERRGAEVLRRFAEGLGVLRRPQRLGAVIWWTTLHWLLQAFSFWLGFRAVGIEAPFGAALLVNGLIAVAAALPQAPGFFGSFEIAARIGLALYAVPGERALSWALGYHILTFIPITLIGLYYFARLGMHFGELQRAGGGATPDDGTAREAVRHT